MSSVIIRVQSPNGTKRITVLASNTTKDLFEMVYETFGFTSFNFGLFKEKARRGEIISSKTLKIGSFLKHGELIYLEPLNANAEDEAYTDIDQISFTNKALDDQFSAINIVEDEVDKFLQKSDGLIERKQEDKFCQHGPKGKCVHCIPLEPYDPDYLKEQNIKHMSFHGYLRKLSAGADNGKFVALENICCHIKPGCKDHPSWPKGICSKCQPSAITLNRQNYRHVDNVMFENPKLVEKFINYWRVTGHQRLGFLYGKYEHFKDVPLGIKARVSAIYEPPQESSRDHIKLLPDDKAAIVDEIAFKLGLKKIGWIFTDLIADDLSKGTVRHNRHASTHFLSAQECIMAGFFQNSNPNPCKQATEGYFGSKFTTVCITGDASNQVHMEGYQVSNQCMALVRENCLFPTKDAPELGFIRESSNQQYVPDVYYKEKDSYGNEVSKLARPLPIEYLLIDVPVSTPLEPQYTFKIMESNTPFPIENRIVDGHIQDFNALASYLKQFTPNMLFDAVCDFHVLLYLAWMDMLPLKDHMDDMFKAVKSNNQQLAAEFFRSEQWRTLEELVSASSGSSPTHYSSKSASATTQSGSVSPHSGSASMWTCGHCTYINQPGLPQCEMCSLPRT